MSRRTRRIAVAATTAAALAVTACSDDDNGEATPTAPVDATSAETTTATSEPLPTTTTEAPTTTAAPTTENPNPTPASPTVPPSTAPQPTDPPDETPTVTTLVPEVSNADLTQQQRNPQHPNNDRPYVPEHRPIIRAYLQAIQASYNVYSSAPIDPEAEELRSSPVTAENLEGQQDALRENRQGQVLNVEQGVTFRPYVVMVSEAGDEAILYDCEIAGHYWEDVDTGDPIPPDEIWRAAPGEIVEVGLRVDMVRRNRQWLVDGSQIDPGACA